ncbi:E3 ubiquitin protein ligase DRIP2 isoform X1 [Cryptomeria japonica]|uniref:E3 ubiquitin protein ligase DRIP2 isoform X1 n=1 Tax=Cryptomeria japonica TaxID=3369 RepID=UPI0025AD2A9D|nr:E3 ubiquitin protein ligase DRIP2 isoform X1 [Cryptomeria japonica]XP_057860514.1 E3 ubiquitin protein ligase DRIP2 isoform X1 [Cryptomeria japonica]XP_057860515.1 E3 ubiquitin protein ligase DRIP2 isoform X1 [Cryptomeria japonica]XP_057860516.1 E3 ubiquitin protein ligase DRIP2 isoform X1 [Cryptomeria japonica]XP_057860517.1 E3 ubiquitin protein ligase DRIP2 isoform X1 [Cryptomeria japonica]
MQHSIMTMSGHFIKTKKRPLVECLTCPLCDNLLREATTICECLHTFCKDCIYQKLAEEDTYHCPICNVYLGCLPKEKLRPDNNLQDVRSKIFPLKKKKMKAAENNSLGSAPARRKERSLSSLVINTPPVSAQAGLSSRTKAVARKAGASRGIGNKVNSGKDVDVALDNSERLDSIERPNKMFIKKQFPQRNSGSDPSNQIADDDIKNITSPESGRQRTGKGTSWEPLACLAEAANRTEISQPPLLGLPAIKTEEAEKYRSMKHTNGIKKRGSGPVNVARKKESGKVHPGTNSKIARKLHPTGPERMSISRKQRNVALENDSSVKYERRSNPVWFALLASETQAGDNALPQIPKCYLKVKDGNVPVSYVKKYLVKKLDLKNESEVEITCCGQPIVPSLSLYSLVEFWIQYAASSDRLSSLQEMDHERAESRFNSESRSPTAEEFMMVLIYARKSPRGSS